MWPGIQFIGIERVKGVKDDLLENAPVGNCINHWDVPTERVCWSFGHPRYPVSGSCTDRYTAAATGSAADCHTGPTH
jgi:hypothetical protein